MDLPAGRPGTGEPACPKAGVLVYRRPVIMIRRFSNDVAHSNGVVAMNDFSSLQEMVLEARNRLDSEVWDFIAGATEAEVTVRRNRHGLDCLAFNPRVLRDVARIDTTTSFLGHTLSIPVMMAPVGSLALIDP